MKLQASLNQQSPQVQYRRNDKTMNWKKQDEDRIIALYMFNNRRTCLHKIQSSNFILNSLLESCPTLHHSIARIRTTVQSTNEGVQSSNFSASERSLRVPCFTRKSEWSNPLLITDQLKGQGYKHSTIPCTSSLSNKAGSWDWETRKPKVQRPRGTKDSSTKTPSYNVDKT